MNEVYAAPAKNREWVVWLVAALFTLVLVWQVNDRAVIRGKLSMQPAIDLRDQKLAEATLLLSQCKKDADLAKPIAKAQRNMADAALDAATKPSKKHSAKLTESLGKLKALRDAPSVAGTSE